uniref:Sodium leak channel NALCN n=1 Tax=Globodera pallida TaxID=36090 RepID=A0A183C3H4_GLOPA
MGRRSFDQHHQQSTHSHLVPSTSHMMVPPQHGPGGRKMSLIVLQQQQRKKSLCIVPRGGNGGDYTTSIAKAAALSSTMFQQTKQQQQQQQQQLQQASAPGANAAAQQQLRAGTVSSRGEDSARRRSGFGPNAIGAVGGVAGAAGPSGGMPTIKRDSMAMIADLLATTSLGTGKKLPQPTILDHPYAERVLKTVCLLSLVSVCLHTPRTLQLIPHLTWILLVLDAFVVAIFTWEAVLRANNMGYFRRQTAYLRDRWCQFDFFLLLFHWVSCLLHVYKLLVSAELFTSFGLVYYDRLGMLRCVRPLVIIRLIRLMLTFKVPRQRIQQLLKRSSTQVQNVTVFFLFFMALYAIMGIQLFGRMDYHCVMPGTDPKNVTINDLAIPDTMCSKEGEGGYECPGNMECMKLDLSAKSEGFYGMFDHFGSSVFTVYLAASEEGWVYVLYDCLDSLPSHLAFFYFITLIFFMAWLVKNVFIAVITETFAEIRVQFSESWKKEEMTTIEDDFSQKIETTEDGWKLIRLDTEDKLNPRIKQFQTILHSTGFQCAIVSLVLANAAINSSFVYRHDETDARRRNVYYLIECAFTVLFDIECLVKLLCYGRLFFKRNIFKFEFILAIGGTLNIQRNFYNHNYFTYFQVFRLFRLIKASPMLEDFVYKIFSPGKKLGGLVLFTVTFVIFASAVSLQLFCSVSNLSHFQTFPQAFMAMFQIITQEGWTEFVVEVLRMIDDRMVPFVAIYFVAYHLFVTLIVLSLFVAVILDNLEMDEELKKVKQLKAKEAISSMRTILPWRLRIFEKFPTRPQMVQLKRVDNEFSTPKVRDSFTNQFVWRQNTDERHSPAFANKLLTRLDAVGHRRILSKFVNFHKHRVSSHQRNICVYQRHIGQCSMRSLLNSMVKNSSKDSGMAALMGPLQQPGAKSRQKPISFFDQILTENGDINRAEGQATGGQQHQQQQTQSGGGTQQQQTTALLGGGGTGTISAIGSTRRDLKQGQFDIRALQHKQQMAEITRNRIEEEMRENHPYFDRPLFIISRESKLRRYCHRFVHARWGYDGGTEMTAGGTNGTGRNAAGGGKRPKQIHTLVGLMPYLDWTMVAITLLSCWSMLLESPWPTTGENLVMFNFYLQIPDYLFVLTMTGELMAKVIADGLFFTPNALVRDLGGVMTVFIYLTSLIFLLLMPKHVEINSMEQFLMICRAMRPLRIYTLVPHIRRVVVELFRGFKEILLVTILMIVVMFIFASFGVQTVGGRLAACNDVNITRQVDCMGMFWQKIFVTRMEVYGKNSDTLHPKVLVPRVWTNPRNFHFDHIGAAMLALFETLSYKGWNVIRDILWARQGPWAVVFIHIYVFIGCMIGLTLFVGVVIANYTENRGTALLTVDQRRWHDLKARLKMAQPLHIPPKPSESATFRRTVYELTMCRPFNQFFAAMVVLNSATLILPWNVEEEEDKHRFLYIVTALSAILNMLFAVEVLLKMFAYTVSGFWQSRRNRIDLLITGMGIFWVTTHFFLPLPASVVGGETRLRKFTYTFGYIVVIMRFFTIAGRNSTLKMLMLTVVMSMFRSFFIIMAMVLLVLFYAYTGVILFGMVKYGQAVSKHVNFRSGFEALVVLFRSVTGEDWNDIMHDTTRSAPFCYWLPGANYWETDCGNYYGAIIYFCSFYLIITYIVRNLLVAIIMENFSLFYSSEEDALLSYADIRNFQQVWNIVDVEQKGQIPVDRVKFLLRLLRGRLEVDPNKDRLLFKHMCYEMEKLHGGDDVSFHDVLYMLSYRSVDIRKSLQLEELLQREELEYIIEEEVAKQTIKTWLEFCLRRMRSPGLPLPSLIQHNQQSQSQIHSAKPAHKTPAFTFSAKSIYAFDSATLAAAHSKAALERQQRQVSPSSPRRTSPVQYRKLTTGGELARPMLMEMPTTVVSGADGERRRSISERRHDGICRRGRKVGAGSEGG